MKGATFNISRLRPALAFTFRPGASASLLASETQADVLPGPVTWFGMTYKCGASGGPHSKFTFRGQQYRAPTIVMPSSGSSNNTYTSA